MMKPSLQITIKKADPDWSYIPTISTKCSTWNCRKNFEVCCLQ